MKTYIIICLKIFCTQSKVKKTRLIKESTVILPIKKGGPVMGTAFFISVS